MKITAIIGSRSFNDYKKLSETLKNHSIESIISGGAVGTDTLARIYANQNNIPITEIKPNYNLGKHAPLIRNKEIVEKSNEVIAFWDGKSRGTKYVIDYATNKKEVTIYYV